MNSFALRKFHLRTEAAGLSTALQQWEMERNKEPWRDDVQVQNEIYKSNKKTINSIQVHEMDGNAIVRVIAFQGAWGNGKWKILLQIYWGTWKRP